jgi:hypothetical protein
MLLVQKTIIKTSMKNHWRTLLSWLPESMQRSIFTRHFKDKHEMWLAAGKPMPVSHQSKLEALREAGKEFGLDTLVETGTFLGDTLYMLYPHFNALYSIELSPLFYGKAQLRFRDSGKITLIQGDSGQELSKLVRGLDRPALFWLDGHYSGGATAKGSKDCPILEELDAIFSSPLPHVLYIDDARLFTGSDDYPTLDELRTLVKKYRPSYHMHVSNDCIRLTPQ